MEKELQDHLDFLLLNWHSSDNLTSETLPDSTKKWWQFWKIDAEQKKSIQNVFQYLLESADDFVRIIYKKYGGIANHEAEILSAISTLYDSTITVPIWLLPFSGKLKSSIMLVIPVLIGYIDNKYNTTTTQK